MRNSILFMLLFQGILIALNAVFACAEIAVISLNENKLNRMAEEGNKKAGKLADLTRQPERFLATIQVAITLSGFLGSAFAADNFSDILVDWLMELGVTIPQATLDTLAVLLITLILSYFTLVFGELVPKRIAMKKSEALALGLSGPISAISKLFSPLVWLLSISTNFVLRLLGVDPNQDEEEVSEAEILLLVDTGGEKGAIDREEQIFIQNVFKFDDLTAEEVSTHRTEVTILWMEESMEEWDSVIRNSSHSRYPVCQDSADQVLGILYTSLYFRLTDKSRENVMKAAVKPAYFVPENMKADVLFRSMKQGRHSIAVVLDEYGGMIGIVTLRNLIEELVGELDIEADSPNSPQIEKIGENIWKVRGNVELADLEQATGVSLSHELYDTFTGLMFHTLGYVPADGQQVDLEAGGLKIHVSQLKNHQIKEALVQLISAQQA